MGSETGIEWTDHTQNFWIGCQTVSPACAHCYAEALVKRWGGDFAVRRLTSNENLHKPYAWQRAAEKAGVRRRVFCSSLADFFDNQVPPEWRELAWRTIKETPNLDWQLLTKRPQNIAKMLPADWGDGYPNVWLGTTVENQEEADRRIPHLLAIPAAVHFLSCEPLLGLVDLTVIAAPKTEWDGDEDWTFNCLERGEYYQRQDDLGRWESGDGPWHPAISWVIIGTESGNDARHMPNEWADGLVTQCRASGVAVFVKQLSSGTSRPIKDMAQFPPDLRVREFPEGMVG